jgi:hypothetical protein
VGPYATSPRLDPAHHASAHRPRAELGGLRDHVELGCGPEHQHPESRLTARMFMIAASRPNDDWSVRSHFRLRSLGGGPGIGAVFNGQAPADAAEGVAFARARAHAPAGKGAGRAAKEPPDILQHRHAVEKPRRSFQTSERTVMTAWDGFWKPTLAAPTPLSQAVPLRPRPSARLARRFPRSTGARFLGATRGDQRIG